MTDTKVGYDEIEKVWRSKPRNKLYDFECSVGQILFSKLRNFPTNVLQISDTEKRSVTHQEALIWGISIAKQLQHRFGLNHEDIVGIAGANTTYVLPVVLGCHFNATPIHAVSPVLPEELYKQMFGITKPKLIFCDGEVYEKVAAATKASQPKIYTLTAHIEGVPKVEDLFMPLPPEIRYIYDPTPLADGGEQTMGIQCSSGTTGLPKAVCLANYRLISEMDFLTNEDVVYSSSSLDWGSGVQTLLMSCFFGSTRVISTEIFSAEHFAKMAREHKITFVFLAYFQVHALISASEEIADSLSSIRYAAVIGAAISSKMLAQLKKLLKNAYITLSYGFSEFGQVSMQVTDSIQNHAGKLIAGVTAKIIDDQGNQLGPNEVGEICVHNGRSWNGYYNNRSASKQMQDDKLWFHSGDIGYFNDEAQLHIVDRKKETRKYKGNQYWPSEIEDVIDELPDVCDACVVSLVDGINGDAAAAAIVKRAGSTLSEQDVKDHVARRLIVPYKQLHAGVWFFDELPYSRNGKKLKREVANLIIQRSHEQLS